MQLPSSQFTLVLEMALHCLFNTTGPAQSNDSNLWITHYALSFILTLFTVLIFIQSTRTFNRTHFCETFYFVHLLFLNTLHRITGLYQLAQECKQITTQQNKNTQRQKQTPPPADEIIIVPDLPTLQQVYSLQPHSVDLLDTPVSLEN